MKLFTSKKSSVRFVDSWASIRLDCLRGLAALVVLFGHGRNLLFANFPDIHVHRRILFPFYALATAGHQAVILFFVLSGYFVGGTVLRSLERGQWSWVEYLLRRVIRLWTVLLPALLLGLFWDRLGIHLGHAPALYAGRVPNNMIFDDVALHLLPHVFFGNMFFLQLIVVPVFGSNSALWSLANEFWYYILFPLAAIAVWRTTRPVSRLVCGGLFVLGAWFVGREIFLQFAFWLAGVLLCRLPVLSVSPRTGRYLRITAILLYIPIFFALGRELHLSEMVEDSILTCVTFFFLLAILTDTERYDPKSPSAFFSREIARFSYTVYASHIPLLVFFTAIFVGQSRWYPTPLHLLMGAGLLLAVLLYSYGIAFLTEFRTDSIRKVIEGFFAVRSEPPALSSNPLEESADADVKTRA